MAPVPPVAATVRLPVPPLHSTFVTAVVLMVRAVAGSAMVALLVGEGEHPLASVTSIVYVLAMSPVNEAVPPLLAIAAVWFPPNVIVKGAAPVTVNAMAPLLRPLQLTFVVTPNWVTTGAAVAELTFVVAVTLQAPPVTVTE